VPTGDVSAPDLPATGTLGRGALFTGHAGRPVLVLESGARYLLPARPTGEGRQGVVAATLSPDGRWLGYRDAHRVGERRYLIRDLTGRAATIVTDGYPRFWSADSRYLSLTAEYGTTGRSYRFDALTASIGDEAPPATAGGVMVGSLLPDGPPAVPGEASPAPPQLRLLVGVYGASLIRTDDPDDECWCAASGLLSPDRSTVSALLRYQPGRAAGTADQKANRRPDGTQLLVRIDAATGAVTERIPLPAAYSWELIADTGDGLLLWRGSAPATLVRLDARSGTFEPVLTVPDSRSVVLPGQYVTAGDA
jgi:hypothetical protein